MLTSWPSSATTFSPFSTLSIASITELPQPHSQFYIRNLPWIVVLYRRTHLRQFVWILHVSSFRVPVPTRMLRREVSPRSWRSCFSSAEQDAGTRISSIHHPTRSLYLHDTMITAWMQIIFRDACPLVWMTTEPRLLQPMPRTGGSDECETLQVQNPRILRQLPPLNQLACP